MSERSYNIRIAAGSRELVAIDDFRLTESSLTVLLGESGVGKSLIGHAIAGLLDSDELDVQIDGSPYTEYLERQETLEIRRTGFFVFQEPSSHLNPLMTLRAQLDEGSLAVAPDDKQLLGRLWRGATEAQIQNILEVYPKPYRPSGGEKQRILSAMAFKKISTLEDPAPGALFVFDEPTGNLDDTLRNEFLDLLVESVKDRRITVLLITHDYSMIGRLTRSYPAIAKKIVFKELVLNQGMLSLRKFLPEEYLSWLDDRRSSVQEVVKRESVLTFESGARVFGRNLIFSRDANGRRPVPLEVRRGSLTYLKAPSGTGKTTVAKMLMGLIKPERMSMRLGEEVYSEQTPRRAWQQQVWGRRVTMVFQHADEALNQNAKVRDVFAGLPSTKLPDDAAILNALSEFFDVEVEFLEKQVKYLSGGQKQRLNLLRCLVLDTEVVILDEPLNGLDFASAVKVLRRIEERLKGGKSVLVISHNEEIFDAIVPPGNVYYLTAST